MSKIPILEYIGNKETKIKLHHSIPLYFDYGAFFYKIKEKTSKDVILKFYADKIRYENDILADEKTLLSFIKLLDCFSRGKLHLDEVYELSVYDGKKLIGGYEAKIVSKDKKKYLRVITRKSKKEFYLVSYDCEVIVDNFKKSYAKCTKGEFLEMELLKRNEVVEMYNEMIE